MVCFEDVLSKYWKISLKELFPENIKSMPKKLFIYLISIVHIVGTYYIFFGMFITPYRYIYVYIFYLLTAILLYFILDDKCFMNDFFKKDSKAGSEMDSVSCKESKMTNLKMSTIYTMLCFFLGISLLSLLFPDLYFQNIIKNVIHFFNNAGVLYNYLPLIIFYIWILLYLLVKLTKLNKNLILEKEEK